MSRGLVIAFSLFLASTSLFGQNSSSEASSSAPENASATQPPDEPAIYVSGFEVLDAGRNGKDLRIYPDRILFSVRRNWYPQIPDLQKSTGRKQGMTVIEFEIAEDGSMGKVKIVESAGDASLDAAASQAILSSAPFPHLPDAYRQKSLKLRMHFGYDQPSIAAAPFCDGPNWGAHTAPYVVHRLKEGITPPKQTYSPDPEYSEPARKAKYMSVVQIAGTVDPQGAFTDLCVTQAAGMGLDEKAMDAVAKWKFEPATLQGEPAAIRIQVEVSFRLY